MTAIVVVTVNNNTYAFPTDFITSRGWLTAFPALISDVVSVAGNVEALKDETSAYRDQTLLLASNGLNTTSTTSLTVAGSGTKAFTIDDDVADMPFTVGMRLRAASAGTPSASMDGYISSITLNTAPTKDILTMTVTSSSGSGTLADWNLFGNVGAQGTAGSGTPSIVGGDTLKVVRVNAGESAYENVDVMTTIDWTSVFLGAQCFGR